MDESVPDPEPRKPLSPCPTCGCPFPSPDEKDPVGELVPSRSSSLRLKRFFVCKQHVLIDGSTFSPVDLYRYVNEWIFDNKGVDVTSVALSERRAPFYLPIIRTERGSSAEPFTEFEFARYSAGNEVVHLPHTWLCSSSSMRLKQPLEGFDGTLFVNWASGMVQVKVPEAKPDLSPEVMRNWPRVTQTWSEVVNDANRVSMQSLLPGEDKDLLSVDASLRALTSEIVLGEHKIRFEDGQTRLKRGSAFIRARMDIRGLSKYVEADGIHRRSQQGAIPLDDVEKAVGIYVFPEAGTLVRRRALLIACTYTQETSNYWEERDFPRTESEPHATELASTVTDAVSVYEVLVKQRGWKAADIVVLTDDMKREEIQYLQRKGVLVDGSDIKSVARWMGRLVSGLGTEDACGSQANRSKHANSLFLFMGGILSFSFIAMLRLTILKAYI